MPLTECTKCGNHYPDRLTVCPKCGAQIHKEKKTRKQRNIELLKYIMLGLLLILTGMFAYIHFISSFPPNIFIFLLSGFTFIAGVITIFAVLVIYLLSVREQ